MKFVVYDPRGGQTRVYPIVAPAWNLYWYRDYPPWRVRGLSEGEELMLEEVGTENEIAFEAP